MNAHQQLLISNRTKEMKQIADQLEAMPISEAWINAFTEMAYYRNWKPISKNDASKILQIAEINSPAIEIIIRQKHSKIGLKKIHEVATIVADENNRVKIAEYLLEKSWENAKKDIELIIAKYKDDK